MQKVLLSSVIALSLASVSVTASAGDQHQRWNKGPFSFIKKHFREFNELVDIVDELADAQPEVIDAEAYHLFDNNYDRHYVDQNGNNAPGKCDQRLVKHRWDGDNITQEWTETNSLTGAACGYTLNVSFSPLSEGKGLYQTAITLPQIPGYQLSYAPGVQQLKAKTRVGESWGEYATITTTVAGNPVSPPRSVLRTSTLLDKLSSVTVPAGTFDDCISVASREEATQADGQVELIAQNISYVCRDVGTVRRVQMVGGYDFQLTSLTAVE